MKKVMVIVGVVVLLASGGAGGWWWWSQRAEAADGRVTEKPAEPAETAAIPLEPFLVNLADKESPRFLRVSVQLVVDNTDLAASFTEKSEKDSHAVEKVRLRSAILELLTTQTSDHLVTTEGKAALKKAIAAQASRVLPQTKVVDVLFTDFVVQF